MKLRRNEIQEIVSLGAKAISGKISELQQELGRLDLDQSRGKLKNVRAGKLTRRAIAVLKTKLKGVK